MKYLWGYVTAGILAAIAWILSRFGERFSTLVDMVYPYVMRTVQGFLAQWSGSVDFLLWQVLAVFLVVVIVALLVVFLILKKSPVTWLGWALAVCSLVYLLHTLVFGLSYYSGNLSDDIRLEVAQYTLDELADATEYYRDQANIMAEWVDRDGYGNVDFAEFEVLAEKAGAGFISLVYDHSYPVFAGSPQPVKKLGWADMYTSMGITGVTMGLTGEAAVNPQIPDVTLPFTMCHEMAHRMCIANERDANFAAFLACSVNPDVSFQYSAYFMAYRYCYSALAGINSKDSAAAVARISNGVSEKLRQDLTNYDTFFSSNRDQSATRIADTANDTYLKTSGVKSGIGSYAQVCDLLVNWHIQTVVLPSVAVEENPFDPYDETQVDLSGIVNAG